MRFPRPTRQSIRHDSHQVLYPSPPVTGEGTQPVMPRTRGISPQPTMATHNPVRGGVRLAMESLGWGIDRLAAESRVSAASIRGLLSGDQRLTRALQRILETLHAAQLKAQEVANG